MAVGGGSSRFRSAGRACSRGRGTRRATTAPRSRPATKIKLECDMREAKASPKSSRNYLLRLVDGTAGIVVSQSLQQWFRGSESRVQRLEQFQLSLQSENSFSALYLR